MRHSIEASCGPRRKTFVARPPEAAAAAAVAIDDIRSQPGATMATKSTEPVGSSPKGHRQSTATTGQCVSMKSHQQQRHPVRAKLMLSLAIAASISLALLQQVPCNAQETRSVTADPSSQRDESAEHDLPSVRDTGEADQPPLDGDEEESLKLSTRLPRQHFRLKVGPTSRASSSFRLVNIRRRAAQQPAGAGHKSKGTKQPNTGPELELQDQAAVAQGEAQVGDEAAANSSRAQKRPQKAASPGKKISSAALKRLLIHTLPRLNGTSAPGPSPPTSSGANKGPNFKFVFIQRATKVPSSNVSSTSGKKSATAKPIGANLAGTKHHQPPPPPQQQQQKPQQQSLAASVSRQLANSLFYSTANFMNFNGTSPSTNLITSLSALAALSGAGKPAPSPPPNHQSSAENELVQLDGTKTPGATIANEDANSNQIDKDETGNNNGLLDIRRLSRPTSSTSGAGQQAAKGKPKKSRPSKIYNLPVKFVSNGQPNSVMFHSIKQHFATIKKLQQQTASAAAGPNKSPAPSSDSSRFKKKLPVKLAPGQSRLKGTNSRLIYLPLKYLSNAKPSMLSSIISGGGGAGSGAASAHKASHKSASLGTKSSKLH